MLDPRSVRNPNAYFLTSHPLSNNHQRQFHAVTIFAIDGNLLQTLSRYRLKARQLSEKFRKISANRYVRRAKIEGLSKKVLRISLNRHVHHAKIKGLSKKALKINTNRYVRHIKIEGLSKKVLKISVDRHVHHAKIEGLSGNALKIRANNHILLGLIQHRPRLQHRLSR